MSKLNYGYWKRGNQYWHIMQGETLLINQPRENYHYNGDASIFFHNTDSPVFLQDGRVSISKEEFETVRDEYIKRLKMF